MSVRPATDADRRQIVDLAIATGLVPDDARTTLSTMIDAAIGQPPEPGHCCLVAGGEHVEGLAYGRPREMTNGSYDLTMLTVDPGARGKGVARALVTGMEDAARALGQRQILIDTSTDPERDAAHAFYRRCGYAEEARIRDYWDAGDDLVVYRKAL